MPIKKDDWRDWFRELPAWICSSCQQGRLRTVDKTLTSLETGASLRGHSHDAWDPSWDIKRFSTHLKCDNPSCADIAVVCGDVRVEEYYDRAEDDLTLIPSYGVVNIYPAPLHITVSDHIPEELKDFVQAASALYWSDPESAANKLRQAVERLLTLQKVKLYQRTGARRAIPLHKRIEDFRDKKGRAEEANVLFAVKWIGNEGSHVGGLSKEDVLDGFNMIEYVLDRLYVGHERNLLRKVSLVNKQKGVRKKRPRII